MSVHEDQLTEAVSWLETEAHRIIRASKREMKDGTAAFPPQVGTGYEAFWLRDYEYTLEGIRTMLERRKKAQHRNNPNKADAGDSQ